MTNLEYEASNYWLNEALKNFKLSKQLKDSKEWKLESLFFLHLTIEKLLKAIYVIKTKNNPLITHDLIYLIEKADIQIDLEQGGLLKELSLYNIEGRYPDYKKNLREKLDKKYYDQLYNSVEKFYLWLLSHYKKLKKI